MSIHPAIRWAGVLPAVIVGFGLGQVVAIALYKFAEMAGPASPVVSLIVDAGYWLVADIGPEVAAIWLAVKVAPPQGRVALLITLLWLSALMHVGYVAIAVYAAEHMPNYQPVFSLWQFIVLLAIHVLAAGFFTFCARKYWQMIAGFNPEVDPV